jgi:hypothetical protein
MPYFIKVIERSPTSHASASMDQWDTGRPGVVEGMLDSTGFGLLPRGSVEVVNEWPDARTAVRVLAAAARRSRRSRRSGTTPSATPCSR